MQKQQLINFPDTYKYVNLLLATWKQTIVSQ